MKFSTSTCCHRTIGTLRSQCGSMKYFLLLLTSGNVCWLMRLMRLRRSRVTCDTRRVTKSSIARLPLQGRSRRISLLRPGVGAGQRKDGLAGVK